MSGNRSLFHKLSCLVLGLVLVIAVSMTAVANDKTSSSRECLDALNVGVTVTGGKGAEGSGSAASSKEYLDTLNVGVTTTLAPDAQGGEYAWGMTGAGPLGKGNAGVDKKSSEKKESDLVMADVQDALNVRAEASEESEKVGLLYKDCGGRILERKDGWTRLRSGDLVGWANDEYLLFGEEAEELADEVGNLIVLIKTEALCVREEPDVNAQAMGFIPEDEELEIIETLDDDWISVKYDEKVGYVSAEYVDIDFHIDEGDVCRSSQRQL